MYKRYLILILTIFPLISFLGCESIVPDGTDPDKVLPSIEWTAMHVGGDPWGISYTPKKTFYWGNYPVSSCNATEGCFKTSESFPGEISINNDKDFLIEVKCHDPEAHGIATVIGNYENPRYHCENFDYYLDNGNENPWDDPGFAYTHGSIHEPPVFFQASKWANYYEDDFLDFEFGFGFGNETEGFSYFVDDGLKPSTESSYDAVAGDNIWSSYLSYFGKSESEIRNGNNPEEPQYLTIRSYYDSKRGMMCNWRLNFFAEDKSTYAMQGELPEIWLEVTE